MKVKSEYTYWVKIYLSGPIDQAKQIIRRECMKEGLCVTIEPTHFIYTGGEEVGYVVGLVQYPKFPKSELEIQLRANNIAMTLLKETYQKSALIMTSKSTTWMTVDDYDSKQETSL